MLTHQNMHLKALKTFCSESSIHGIPYLSNDDIHLTEKIFWTIFTIFSFICCLLLIGNILAIVQDDPTVIYSSDSSVSVTSIPFPAVTICYDLLAYGNETYSFYHDIRDKLRSREITVNDLSEDQLKNLQAIGLITSDDYLLNYNVSQIPTNDIGDRVDQFTISYHKLYLRSIFSDVIIANLAKVLGQSGYCFNFNTISDKRLYKNLENASNVFRYKHNMGNSLMIQKYQRAPILYKHLNLTNPLSLVEANSNYYVYMTEFTKGLKLTIDELTKTYEFYKFPTPRIYIHNPFELYSRYSVSYYNYPDAKIVYIVDPKQKIIDDNLKDSEPEVRGCYFIADGVEHDEDERVLKYFNIYTKGNCKQECLINRTLEVCGCVQFFMIHDSFTRICGIHDMKCYKQVEDDLDGSELCKCYPSCGEVEYNVKQTVSTFVKPIKIHYLDSHIERTRPRKQYLSAYVKFNTISFFPFVLKRQFTEIDFIAYTGGAFGLFLGISITSFIELFYYFTMRLMFGWLVSKGYGSKVEPYQSNGNDEGQIATKSRFSYLVYYFSISTVHGMNQIVMDYRHYVERMFWILILGLSLFYCGVSSYDMYIKFKQASIAITYDSDESSVESIPFPAIYFTPEVRIPPEFIEYDHDIKRFNITTRLWFFRKYEVLFNYVTNAFLCDYRYLLNDFRELEPSQQFDDYNILYNMYQFGKFSWVANQSAIWDNKYRPEMTEFLGKSGYGFAFNMLEPERMFKNETSLNFTSIYDTIKFDINGESKNLELIHYQSYPLYARKSTTVKFKFTKRDLQLYKNICQFPFFNVFSPFEMPKDIDDDNSFDFFFGQDLEVLITPEVIKSDEGLRKFPAKKRNCYFEGEKKLKLFKIYTRKNCEMECLAEYYMQLNETQCVPYYVLRNVSHPICKVIKHFHITLFLFDFYQKDYRSDNSGAYLPTCGCLDTCNDVKYSIDVIETKIAGENKDKDNATMTVTFKYKNDKFLPLVRRISFTFEDFLCQTGGLLGLYAGISALSVVELLYFVFIRPLFNLHRWFWNKIFKRV